MTGKELNPENKLNHLKEDLTYYPYYAQAEDKGGGPGIRVMSKEKGGDLGWLCLV